VDDAGWGGGDRSRDGNTRGKQEAKVQGRKRGEGGEKGGTGKANTLRGKTYVLRRRKTRAAEAAERVKQGLPKDLGKKRKKTRPRNLANEDPPKHPSPDWKKRFEYTAIGGKKKKELLAQKKRVGGRAAKTSPGSHLLNVDREKMSSRTECQSGKGKAVAGYRFDEKLKWGSRGDGRVSVAGG